MLSSKGVIANLLSLPGKFLSIVKCFSIYFILKFRAANEAVNPTVWSLKPTILEIFLSELILGTLTKK